MTGQKLASNDELLHRTFQLYLGVEMGIGLGIFSKASDELTFFSNVQQTLLLYRRELIEACVASAFIGFLALATSLFSMQVYDRVIPTRSEYTLMILSAGVLISIFVELAMKFARSHIMDYVVVGLDGKLSREIFQRLLQLRVDQVPASVGSLAGQLRGYEQVRGFYTASTLFTLIDLPLALLFIVVLGTLVPFYCYLLAVKTIGPQRTSLLACAEPLSAALVSVWWLNVAFGWLDVVGSLCIVLTIYLLAREKQSGSDPN